MGSLSVSHIPNKGQRSKWVWSLYVFRVPTFSAKIYTINVPPGRLSVLFVDIALWSCFVLFSWFVFFQFNFEILYFYSVIIVTSVHLFLAVAFSFAS